jgi:hypothetical protein
MALALASAETRESEAAILYVTPLASFAKGRREIKGWIFGVRKLDGLLRPFRHAAVLGLLRIDPGLLEAREVSLTTARADA